MPAIGDNFSSRDPRDAKNVIDKTKKQKKPVNDICKRNTSREKT